MHLDLYAIRHKPTGGWIPQRYGRGGSHDEPTLTGSPRLFMSLRAARSFLMQWLKGVHVRDGYMGDGGEREDDVTIRKVDSRKPEEMEIVRFEAQEQAPANPAPPVLSHSLSGQGPGNFFDA